VFPLETGQDRGQTGQGEGGSRVSNIQKRLSLLRKDLWRLKDQYQEAGVGRVYHSIVIQQVQEILDRDQARIGRKTRDLTTRQTDQ
jgi:hypothetical protein